MALERLEFERMYRGTLPGLTAEERALLERVCGVSRNGKSSKAILPESLTELEKLWKRVQEKIANQPRRRGYGNG